jgi:hypothetical protein
MPMHPFFKLLAVLLLLASNEDQEHTPEEPLENPIIPITIAMLPPGARRSVAQIHYYGSAAIHAATQRYYGSTGKVIRH